MLVLEGQGKEKGRSGPAAGGLQGSVMPRSVEQSGRWAAPCPHLALCCSRWPPAAAARAVLILFPFYWCKSTREMMHERCTYSNVKWLFSTQQRLSSHLGLHLLLPFLLNFMLVHYRHLPQYFFGSSSCGFHFLLRSLFRT